MVLPVCRISVSICCDKRRETSFTVPAESGRSGERRDWFVTSLVCRKLLIGVVISLLFFGLDL